MSSGVGSSGCYRRMLAGKGIRSASIGAWWREVVYRYRTGISWRDLPRDRFGPWQTVWKRRRWYACDGTWDCVLAQLLADGAGLVDWNVSVDGTINRAHQHATDTTRPEQDTEALSNYKNRPLGEAEPAGHGEGRSRSGLTTKVHHGVDGKGPRRLR